MIRMLLALAFLPTLAFATEHFIGGMDPGTKSIVVDGVPSGSVLILPGGAGSFESDLRGRFELAPTGTIQTDCANLKIINASVPIPPCGSTASWQMVWSAQNTGTVAAGSFVVRVTLTPQGASPSIKCEVTVPSLAPGAIHGPVTCTLLSGPPTPGATYAVLARADQRNTVFESDETDNDFTW